MAVSDDEINAFLASPSKPAAASAVSDDEVDAFLGAKPAQSPSGPSDRVTAGIRSVLSGVTFGAAPWLAKKIDQVLGIDSGRDFKAEYKADKEAYPKQFFAGELVGGLLVPVPGAGAAAGLGRTVGKAAATWAVRGGLSGAVSGAAQSEATDPMGVARDAAVGGLVGTATGYVTGGLAQRWLGGAQERVNNRLMADIARDAHKGVRDSMARKGSDKIAGTAREFGLDRLAKEPKDLLPKALEAKGKVGKQLGKVYDEVDKRFGGVSVEKVISALGRLEQKYVERGQLGRAKAVQQVAGEVIDSFGDKASTKAFHGYASDMGNRAFEGVAGVSEKAGAKLNRQISGAITGALREHIDEAAKASADVAKVAKGLPRLNRQYGSLADIGKAAQQRADKAAFPPTGLRSFSLKGVAEEAYRATAGRVTNARDVQLARLVKAAQGGDLRARVALEAALGRLPTAVGTTATSIPGVALDAAMTPLELLAPSDDPY